MAETVTINKEYFGVLLRRAQANLFAVEAGLITILKTEHERLLDMARQLENMKANLIFSGGCSEDVLVLLANSRFQVDEEGDDDDADGGVQLGDSLKTYPVQPTTYIRSALDHEQAYKEAYEQAFSHGNIANGQQGSFQNQFYKNGVEESPYMSSGPVTTARDFAQHGTNGNVANLSQSQSGNIITNDPFGQNGNNRTTATQDFLQKAVVPEKSNDNGFKNPQEQGQNPRMQKNGQRSILLGNLAESTTYADIIAAVKGGMLLDLNMKADRSCAVSFLHENDARAFYGYVKRNDLYIRGKRVEIDWCSHQHVMSSHMIRKIQGGATRVLIIRNATPAHSEKLIREHAEHIDKLVVISVVFQGNDIVVECNSVHNAHYLKMCLISRACYKASRIEWFVDPCAEPLPPRPSKRDHAAVAPIPKMNGIATTMNRFQALLNMDDDGTEHDSDDEPKDDTHFTTTT